MSASTETFDRLIEALEVRQPADRLMVMAQNPADNHHWSRNLATVTAADLLMTLRVGRAALALVEAANLESGQ